MTRLLRAKPRASWTHPAFAAVLLASTSAALAQTSPVETIVVTGTRQADTAAAVAPTAAPLDAIQPTSVLTQDYIQKNLPPSGNYDEAIEIAPSVFDTAPNGPGLAESQNISIRGFQDGQFNETFDGIPWNDANDFTHHSTSYFMQHDLGEISVDRGPGTAATIGNATFGGTVSILSKAPANDFGITPYASYGSFNTLVYGGEIDSGTIDATGGTRVMVDAESLNSSGYLTNLALHRDNFFTKIVQPLGNNTTLTFAAMYNGLHQNISLGATAADIAKFGPDWGLSRDPTQQNYYGYNLDRIETDFEYADLESDFGDGWSFDSKVYTMAYFHHGLNGEDPNGADPNTGLGGFPNGTCKVNSVTECVPGNPNFFPNDVPGQYLTNDYRSFGTITRLTKEFAFGDIKTGIWYDNQINKRSLFEVDMSNGFVPNLDPNTGAVDGVDRDLHQTLQTLQPYFQVDWTPIEALTISPGVRYSWFDRKVNADVNVKTGLPQSYDNTFDAVLPSVAAHYAIEDDWTAYAQVAEGFLAPNENFFNRQNPNSTNVSPQKSWNYQAGTAVQWPNLAASADIYYIDFSNLIASRTVGGQTVFFNQGGVTYMGIEGEATYTIGDGLSIYANGSLNSAKDQTTHQWIANAPDSTWALGPIYSFDGIYASVLGKYVGARYGDVGQTQGLSPLFTMDASLGYDLSHMDSALRNTWVQLQVYNVTDTTKITNLAGYTVQSGTPLYWTQPARSVFVTVSTTF